MNILLITCMVVGLAPNYQTLREQMVKEQIIKRGVQDSLVLKAMLQVERHKFVPQQYRNLAYIDRPLPIGYEQTISQPYIVALMTSLLNLKGDEKVLEIGTGSGYQAAILGELAKEVYSIEILEPLAESAKSLLESFGYTNIFVKCGDGYKGWPEHALFDAIIVTCAPPSIPEPLLEQLKVGGRMVIPVGTAYQELLLITRTQEGINKESIIPVIFVPMQGKAQDK